MLRLEHISKIYPTGEVLKDVNWEVKPGDRIGLVGVNGAGKSTQLNIVAGRIEPTSGEIIRPNGMNIAYLSQEFDVISTNTVREELFRAFSQANEVHEKLLDVQHRMETEPENLDKLLKQMDRYQREFEGLNGYDLEADVEKLLPQLNFSDEDGDRLVSSFSGGWQMRMGLGKIMLQSPDLLLLDEPTNHLDLETIEWLEKYLLGLTTPMVIVSHDREFLDRLCNQIVETERGVSASYLGNYSQYLEQKEFNRATQQSTYERQKKELDKQQAFVEKFRASATRSTQAKSREKQLAKIDRIELPDAKVRSLRFRFPPAPRSGREVIIAKDLVHEYNDNILFLGANLLVERGDRIAIVGPNGAGKSTLLRLLMGMEEPTDGSVKLGEHQVIPGYFEQNQAEALDLSKTVMATIHDEVPDWKNEEVRTLLGQFLFSGETAFKQVEALSGGEKARLALAKMLLQPMNLLVLDEPTNHLDIPAKEMLEDSLSNYEDGTVVIVSHDRFFISRVANKIVEVRDGQLVVYRGDYHYYLDKKEEEREKARLAKLEAEKETKATAKREKQKEKQKERKGKKKAKATQ